MYSPICFVVECYEPYILRMNKKEIEYSEMTQDEIKNDQDVKKMKRKIVGTVSIRNHNSLHESAWLYRLAVDPEYPYTRVGKILVESALKHAFDQKLYTCETVSAECHEDFRELLLKVGFMIKQIYHKSIVGSSLRVMKAQMGIDLERYFRNQKRNLNVK
jgi:N-acetylglutamate synthase-like GNAT family acetyltransferase